MCVCLKFIVLPRRALNKREKTHHTHKNALLEPCPQEVIRTR